MINFILYIFIAKLGHSTSDYVTNSGEINIFFFLENTFYLKQNKRKKRYYNQNQTNLIFNEVIEFNRIRFKKQIIFWLLKKSQSEIYENYFYFEFICVHCI